LIRRGSAAVSHAADPLAFVSAVGASRFPGSCVHVVFRETIEAPPEATLPFRSVRRRCLVPRRIDTLAAAGVSVLVLPIALLAPPSPALERVARLGPDLERDEWAAGGTVSIAYYNTCTGWHWIWWGWGPFETVGVNFTGLESGAVLESNWWYVWTAAPSGRGFTGTIDVFAADEDGCPVGEPLATQAYIPVSGWNLRPWGGLAVPTSFIVSTEMGPGVASPMSLPSDHPAAGPTGPQACGTCYPTTRVNHSYNYGTRADPLCPGSPFFDGICDAQLLLDVQLVYPLPVEEEASWGKLKGLYR
jgi:hypothetical protein